MKPFSSSRTSHPHRHTKLPRLCRCETTALILLPLFVVVLVCVINFPHEFNLIHRGSMWAFPVVDRTAAVIPTCKTDVNVTTSLTSPPPPEFRILVGVLTMADKYEVRHLHRLVNSFQPKITIAQIDLKFVFCNLTSGEHRALVSLEVLRYDDIMILNCKENMNNGKTYQFFSTVAKIFNQSSSDTGGGKKPYYDYVMKADDDSYLQFPELAASLKPLPRVDLYYGLYVAPDKYRKGDPRFMAGMAFALSWDLVEWVATSDVARNRQVGFEDRVVGMWMRDGGRGKNIYDTRWFPNNTGGVDDKKWFMYDLPKPPARFLPNTVCVHRIKTRQHWERVIQHFNLTAGLTPSKFHSLIA